MYTMFLGIFYSVPAIEHSHYHAPSTRDHFGSAYNLIETKNVRHRNEQKTLAHTHRPEVGGELPCSEETDKRLIDDEADNAMPTTRKPNAEA